VACGAGTVSGSHRTAARRAGNDTLTADADRSIEDGGRGPKELTGMAPARGHDGDGRGGATGSAATAWTACGQHGIAL
jgi:hypothetical protein